MDRNRLAEHIERQTHRGRWVLIGFLAIAAFFLWEEHRAHLLGILPYLLVLACPLMHLFHHGDHHGRGRSTEAGNMTEATEQAGDNDES